MRRLFLAAALALALHSLLFAIRFEGSKAKPIPPPRPLTLSLTRVPAEPLPPVAVSKMPERPNPPLPPHPQPKDEKRQPQKTRKSEKSSRRIESSFSPKQEQESPSNGGRGVVAEQVPVPETFQESPFPAQASLGGEGRELPTIPVREALPLYRLNPSPTYPMIARKRGYQGTVVLDVLVSREGRVKELSLSASSGYSVLDQAALTSVKTWLFNPGTRGGEEVDMWVKVPVRFKLE